MVLRSIKNKDKYCFPIVEFSPPIKQALKFDDANNTLKVLYPGSELKEPNIDKTYFDAGQFYGLIRICG